VQVASSEQHTVRPWFAGRSDLAPPAKDLAADGFPLLGGRLDYVDGHRTSVLVYKRRLHTINVFMWPAPATAASAARVTTRNGYALLSFTRGGVATWLVSDLNPEELHQLAALL
jgi:anti-sigma factor RsiW